ncbi:hypothetical protein [Agrococcus sp. ProA11]|uniref:hypothetical protein n=1 Tax=Agrococcus chionoecetis TaxID=3153752 RepID=UPI003261659A
MESVVKVFCEGVGHTSHDPLTLALFRDDGDGWARVHNEGDSDPILWEPSGEVSIRHTLDCDRCPYKGYFKPETLYPQLDAARARGWMPAPR